MNFPCTDKKPLKRHLNETIYHYNNYKRCLERELDYLNKKINGIGPEIDYIKVDDIQRIFIRKGSKEDNARLKEINEELIIVNKVLMSMESILNYDIMLK